MTPARYIFTEDWKRKAAGVLDAAGSLFSPARPSGRIDPARLHKFLLLRLDHIGDMLMTTPAIRALRRSFPAARIDVLAKGETAAVLRGNPHADRIVVFNAPWTTTRGKPARASEIFSLIRTLRRERYDCVVAFRADPREALLSRSTGAPLRLGCGERGGGFCFTHLFPLAPRRHEIERCVSLLGSLGIQGAGEKMDIFTSEEEEREAEAILRSLGGEKGRGWAGIHPGAASPRKRWPVESFARLGDLLSGEGFRIVLLGSPAEEDLLGAIASRMKRPPPRLAPASLGLLAALIRRLCLLVGNDTAPSHIAQATGTRSVVIFGPTHDAVTGPLDREKHAVARRPFDCAPCWLPGTKFRCDYDLRCLQELEPERVMGEVKKVTNGYERLLTVTNGY
jgi:ADP-heptose:LPS heptosyltransferase